VELEPTERFIKDYERLPAWLRKQVGKKLELLVADIGHRSLRVKPLHGNPGIYEGSITMKYRFLFTIKSDAYVLLRVGTHDILDTR
jgi:mRNA-degrading endonuclease RelE of RelBE toxin-antitoxin system